MDSGGVDYYWVPLKPDLLPSVITEVDRICQRHKELFVKAARGETKYRKELEFLNVTIRARIEDFDNYYNKHFQDYRLPYFEKQKYRLKRLVAESSQLDPLIKEG